MMQPDLFEQPEKFTRRGDSIVPPTPSEVARAGGRVGRDEGIARAAVHAEVATPGWNEKAYAWLVQYAASTSVPFSTMECRKAAYAAGLPRPPTEFAWGGVTVRARKLGVIVRAGDDNVGDGTSHSKLTPLWRAA